MLSRGRACPNAVELRNKRAARVVNITYNQANTALNWVNIMILCDKFKSFGGGQGGRGFRAKMQEHLKQLLGNYCKLFPRKSKRIRKYHQKISREIADLAFQKSLYSFCHWSEWVAIMAFKSKPASFLRMRVVPVYGPMQERLMTARLAKRDLRFVGKSLLSSSINSYSWHIHYGQGLLPITGKI